MTTGAGAGAGAAVDGWDADAVHDEAGGVVGGSEAGGGAEHESREAGSAASARVGVATGGSGSGGDVRARASVEEALACGATRDAHPFIVVSFYRRGKPFLLALSFYASLFYLSLRLLSEFWLLVLSQRAETKTALFSRRCIR